MESLWSTLHQVNRALFPQGPKFVIPDKPKVRITYHNNSDSQFSAPDLKGMQMQFESACSMSPAIFSTYKNAPACFLKMIKNQSLTRAGCGKDVHHFEFEFVLSAIDYEVGDVLEVLPRQDPAAVDAFIQCCNLDPETFIIRIILHISIRLRTFVELTMDVASASPRRYFFEVMSFFATAERDKERLEYFVSREGRDDLLKERRTVLEVLEEFPSVQMPFEWLVQLVQMPLKTRSYSISSSQLAHPNQVHLTVDVVSWTTPCKKKRKGLCSTWLASLDPQQSTYIPAWSHKGSLPSPKPSRPLILVGPGTGCAPFRGFVEERAIQSLSSTPTAPIIFFFGCRNEESDFLYRDFWLSHSQDDHGVLSEAKGGGFGI